MNKMGVKIFVNTLTIFRCIFTFAMPFLIKRVSNITFLIFIIALFFTDYLDGFVSRKCKAQTLFGSLMDTIADKVLCIVLIVCIASKSPILLIMLIGEMIIGTINLIGTINGAQIVAIMLGKVKMWALAIATIVGYMFYFNKCNGIWVTIFGLIVIVMQVIVIIQYWNKVRKVKEIKREKIKFKKGDELKYALFNTDYYLSTIDIPIRNKLTLD